MHRPYLHNLCGKRFQSTGAPNHCSFQKKIIRGTQRRFPPKYIGVVFQAIQNTLRSLEMHSKGRYKICTCLVILGELESFRKTQVSGLGYYRLCYEKQHIMPVALLFFWPNYAKIMLVFPNYATFLKLCSSKTMANKSKNTFSLTRSRLLLLATIYNGLWSFWLVRARHFSERAVRFRSNRLAKLTPFCSLAYERYWDRHGLP